MAGSTEVLRRFSLRLEGQRLYRYDIQEQESNQINKKQEIQLLPDFNRMTTRVPAAVDSGNYSGKAVVRANTAYPNNYPDLVVFYKLPRPRP